MKDKQGIKRGKCTSCECEEYIAPNQDSESKKPLRVRCDYCNHTPVEHLKVIALGKCSGCAPGNCDEYESEEPFKYTDCSYCACPAKNHAGFEKLIPKKVSAQAVGPVGASVAPVGSSVAPGVSLRYDETGNPVQTAVHGLCKYPGCKYPRRTEKGHVFDYCSRTCADKARSHPLGFGGTSNSSMMQPPLGFSQSSGGHVGNSASSHQSTPNPGPFNSMTGRPSDPNMRGGPPKSSLMSTPGPSSTVCSKCQKNPPNRGHRWCENCYISKK